LDKKVVNVAVVAAIAGLLLGYVAGYFGTNVASLEQRINSLESQIDSLESQLNIAELQKNNLQTWLSNNITYYEGQIVNLESQITTKDATINQLTSQISTLQNQIEDLQRQQETQILGVYFSPNGGCENQVISWINRANSTIHILIYSFTIDRIGDALVVAHNRGVNISIVFEKEQMIQECEYRKLKAEGINVRNDTNSGLLHDKIMIIDGTIVLTGSFNYSVAGEEKNNENLIIVRSTSVAGIYEAEFERIWNQSV